MFDLPEIIEHRLISLAWVDDKDEAHKVSICSAENLSAEQDFSIEFEKKGWVYNKVIEIAGVDLSRDTCIRLVSETLPFICL